MYVWRRNKNRGILPKYRKSPPLRDGVFLFWWRWAESNRRAIREMENFYKS